MVQCIKCGKIFPKTAGGREKLCQDCWIKRKKEVGYNNFHRIKREVKKKCQ